MQRIWFAILALGLTAGGFSSCQQSANGSTKEPSAAAPVAAPYVTSPEWNAYWYNGKAEITSYNLQQSRYGEIHSGTLVNIFVTEDFSKSKQVKLDDPGQAGNDRLPVLKLNQSIKFNTGIYPYSIMMSTYQPVDINQYPNAVKITGSAQEWCGMGYFQLNQKDDGYHVDVRSYFESEGDKSFTFNNVMQEDAVWNIIRIDPSRLPKGEQMLLPGSTYLRLSHKPVEPVKASCDLRYENGVQVYIIDMSSLDRQLKISFESKFPYRILSWTDSYPGFDGKKLTTTAVRNKELIIDYWRTHGNADRALRDQLGLPRDTQ